MSKLSGQHLDALIALQKLVDVVKAGKAGRDMLPVALADADRILCRFREGKE